MFGALYFQYLQNRSIIINVHATHTMHGVPDLRIAAGRLRDGPLTLFHVRETCYLEIIETEFLISLRADLAIAKVRELKATDPFRSLSPVDPYRVNVASFR
jgi:hypothetical protein